MKKLFFTALVAVVAVGGAYAQQQYQAQPESENEFAPKFTCTILESETCGSTVEDIYLADSDTLVSPGSGSAYDRQYN